MGQNKKIEVKKHAGNTPRGEEEERKRRRAEDRGRLTRVTGTEGRKSKKERLVDGRTRQRKRGEEERRWGGRGDGSISVGAPLPRQRGLSPPGGTQTLSPCPALYSPLATAARSI